MEARLAGYLDHYGEGEEKRERLIKRTLLITVVVLAVGGVLFFYFKNYRQEQLVGGFFERLQNKDYQGAYVLWGCTASNPCPAYPFESFMQDWGPGSPRANVQNYRITRSRSCGSGVILTVDFGQEQEERLWVEKRDNVISFSPYPGCPNL
jgi:hypothetical protein